MMFFKYYRVYRNCTDISVTSVNDFNRPHTKDVILHGAPGYHLPADSLMYYEYSGLVHAMEQAKAGALKYITMLIKQGQEGISRLLQYRMDNYENLNVVLINSNIRRIERDLSLAAVTAERR